MLPDGEYTIRNLSALWAGCPIFGHHLSGRQPVILESNPSVPPTFELRSTSEGTTIIVLPQFGPLPPAPTSTSENLLWASSDPPSENWTIEAVPQHGEDLYIILTANREEGWVGSQEPNDQIQVQALIIQPSEPGHYLPSQLWHILPKQ